VPNAIAGPTDPHVAAIFYNPAALGPLRGVHLHVEGSALLHEGSIDRDASAPGGGGSAPINFTDFDAFAGVSWDLNTDSFTVGLAVLTPLTDLTQFGDSPVRYQAIHNRQVLFEQSVAAAFKISSRFYLGVGANFAEDWIDYSFARDVALQGGSQLVSEPNALCGGMPCGYENPLARQDARLRGFNWGIGFSVGVLARPIDRLWLGLSYVSRVFNTGHGSDFPLSDANRPRVTPAAGQPEVCWNGLPNAQPLASPPVPAMGGNNLQPCNDVVTIAIPDLVHLGVRVEVSSRFDLEGWARWIRYGQRSSLDVNLQGGRLAQVAGQPAASVPPDFVLDRGFRDAYAFELSGRWKLGERWRLSPSVVFETSAVDDSLVNAASIDAPKFDLTLTAEWRPVSHFVVGAHAGATTYVLWNAGEGFNPTAQVACVDARGALDACSAYNNGDALPSAAGRYTYVVVYLGASVGMEF
jgi:long-subunit fatty acid transport protein